MEEIEVRRAVAADAGAAADLLIRARAAAAASGSIPAGVHGADDVLTWIASVVLPGREVWVTEVAPQVAAGPPDGLLAGLLVLDGGWVDQLYLAPECTGQGLGSRLLEVAKARRPGGLQLWTFQSNAGAQRFYERHGFVAVERTDGSRNEERSPDIRYQWRPRPSRP